MCREKYISLLVVNFQSLQSKIILHQLSMYEELGFAEKSGIF